MNGNIDPDCSEHDTYLTEFQENVMLRLQHFINQSIELKPELNARNKAIQVIKDGTLTNENCVIQHFRDSQTTIRF